MAATESITTAEQLLEAADFGRCELVRGELVMMSPSGDEHGRAVIGITGPLYVFIKQHPVGVLYGAETGFLLSRNPDTVRAPDLAFVSKDRVSPRGTRGFVQAAPDLAVEVLSPDDRAREVTAKVHDWLEAGCRMVWVINPWTRKVFVWRSARDSVELGESDILTADDLLPGFRLAVAEIFAT